MEKRARIEASNYIIDHFPFWFLDALHSTLVPSCARCLSEKTRCMHMTGETNEFPFFWKLRAVKKSWKESTDTWIKSEGSS